MGIEFLVLLIISCMDLGNVLNLSVLVNHLQNRQVIISTAMGCNED